MRLVTKGSSAEILLRRAAPQAIIILILTVLMVVGAVIFQRIDPAMAKKPFYEVLFFEFVTISTIGYGDQSPTTPYSKMFAVAFSILGIPLLIVTLGNFGKYLTKFFWKARGLIGNKETERELVNDTDIPGPVLAFLYAATFFFGYLFFPHNGIIFTTDEIYLSFISFATVGFGDFAPQVSTIDKFWRVMVYLMWGTMLNIMLINYLTNCFSQLITRQPFRGRDVEVFVGDQGITVSEITSLVAKQFHASPHQVREMLHEIDDILAGIPVNDGDVKDSEVVRLDDN